jgi:prepilin-type processing-associated H-X9-DG protein
MRCKTTAVFLLILGLSSSARAAITPALAERIPADAIVYAGWAGSEQLFPQYDQSHLKSLLDASSLPQLFGEDVPQLIDRVASQDKQAAEVMRQVVAIGAPLWKHPTALYFGGIDFNGPQPLPKLAILCDAGTDAPALAEQIQALLKQAEDQNPGPMPTVKVYGTLVVFAFGTPASIDDRFGRLPIDPLSKAPAFIAALAQVQKDPALVEYIDAPAAVELVDDVLQKQNDQPTIDRWTKARDALGLTGLHQMIASTGFDGRDWETDAFVGTSDSTTGILSLFHGTPLSAEILKAVPQSADRLTAGKFNLDAFVGSVRDLIAEFDEGTAGQVDNAIAQINQAAGLDIRKDFLATLGDEWCAYSDRAVGGPGLMGTVVVNRLKDATGADRALTQLAGKINDVVAQLIHQPQMKIEIRDEVVNGVTLHYLAVPLITPCWAISDGNLYLALYPQMVSAAVEQVKTKAPSILQRNEFTAILHKLGDHPAGAIAFYDLPETAPDGYAELLMISRLYLGFSDVLGVHPPSMVIPPLARIMPELSPAGSITWTDAAGFHMRSISPFPGAEMVAGASIGSGAMVGQEAMLVSILLPSLNKARETANRVKCASNMHQIWLGIILYQNDHQQKYPDDLGVLVKAENLTGQVFICPSGSTRLPDNFATLTPDDQAKWVNDNSDYVYLGKGQTNPDATRIILYEKDGAHGGDGMNLLFGDGHVEWFKTDAATKMISDQGK